VILRNFFQNSNEPQSFERKGLIIFGVK